MTLTIAAFGVGFAAGSLLTGDRSAVVRSGAVGGFVVATASLVPQVAPPSGVAMGVLLAITVAAAAAGVMAACLSPTARPTLGGAALAVGALLGVATVAGGELQVPLAMLDQDGVSIRSIAGWMTEDGPRTRTALWRASPLWAGYLVMAAIVSLGLAASIGSRAPRRWRIASALLAVIAAASSVVLCSFALAGVGLPAAVPADLPPPGGSGSMPGPSFVTGSEPAEFVMPIGWVALGVAGLFCAALGVRYEMTLHRRAAETRPAWITAVVAGTIASGSLAMVGVSNADPAWWSEVTYGGILAITLLVAGAGWMGLMRSEAREPFGALVVALIAAGLTAWTVIL